MTHSLHINKLNFFDIESFIKVYINDYSFYFEDNYTLLQACLLNDIYLPRFCYHSKLSIVGNCRLCYIEEIKTNKPLVSCAIPVVNDLEIFTETRLVTKARHGLLELLLINHPLDCPVCDQGSECDLQDQFFVFGNEDSRYFENKKRNVIDKNISPLIKLSLNRCIHCARCTRFTQEIGGLYSFSLLGRGVSTEISNYLPFFFKFELSGNIIDLCPVGALTAKSYSFSLRYWELLDVKLIDIFDVMHTYIRLDFYGTKLLRILPLSNYYLDEEWITDKIRFNYDGYVVQRYLFPLFNIFSFTLYYFNISWLNIIHFIKHYFISLIQYYIGQFKILFNNIIFSNNFVDLVNLNLFKFFFLKIGMLNNFFSDFCREKNLLNDFRKYFYINNINFDNIENFLLIGFNSRIEMPLLNLKIREKIHNDYIGCYVLGFSVNLNFFYYHGGNLILNFFSFIELNFLKLNLSNLLICFGKSMLQIFCNLFNFFSFFICFLKNIFNNAINILNVTNLTNLNLLSNEIFLTNGLIAKNVFLDNLSIVYNLNSDEFFTNNHLNLSLNKLNIYQGHHAEYFTKFSSIILPVKFFYEKSLCFINILGILNNYKYLSYRYLLKKVKDDWKILRLFSEIFLINCSYRYDSIISHFIPKYYKEISYKLINYDFNFNNFKKTYNMVYNTIYMSIINNFYLSDIISRVSFNMLNCSKFLNILNDFIYIRFFNFNLWIY